MKKHFVSIPYRDDKNTKFYDHFLLTYDRFQSLIGTIKTHETGLTIAPSEEKFQSLIGTIKTDDIYRVEKGQYSFNPL